MGTKVFFVVGGGFCVFVVGWWMRKCGIFRLMMVEVMIDLVELSFVE